MVGYLTTDANGEFTGTIQGISAGTYILTAEFEGDSSYNPTTDSKYFNVRNPNIELSLVTSTQIVEIGDTITITATLTKEGLPFVNEEIEYEIKHGSTIIDSDSDFTNNAGQITISYTGTGIGDINVTATYNSITETLGIEDCLQVITDFSTGWTTSGIIKYYNAYTIPDNTEVSFEFESGLSNARVGIGDADGQYCAVYYHNPSFGYYCMYNTNPQILHTNQAPLTLDSVLSVKLTGSTAKWFYDGTEFDNGSINTNYRKNIRLLDYSLWEPKRIKIKAL